MNVTNLLNAVKYFEEEPLRLDMGEWLKKKSDPNFKPALDQPPCGTVACLAGSAVVLKAQKLKIENPYELLHNGATFQEIGCEFFDIEPQHGDELFLVSNWPEPYQTIYTDLTNDFYALYHPDVTPYIKKKMVYILKLRVGVFIKEQQQLLDQ